MSVKIDGNGEIIGATNTVPTGMTGSFLAPSAPAGWLALNGSAATIGNAGSGSTIANNTVKALFFLWWGYLDAQLPILTRAGDASTRGANAQADWDALKRLTVFNTSGRFLRDSGTINGVTIVNGTAYADTLKDHIHALSPMVALPGSGGALGYTYNNAGTGAPLGAGNVQAAGGAPETAPASLGSLRCVKL